MWFADIGVVLGGIALGAWLAVAVTAHTLLRFGRSRPALLLSPSTRLPLLVGGGAVALLLAVQAGLVDTVADSPGTGVVDEEVWSWFVDHRTATLTTVMLVVSTVGDTAGMAVLALIGALVLWRRRRRIEAAVVLAAALGAAGLVRGFKTLYGRVRPPVAEQLVLETNPSLPSGHALLSVVVLGLLAVVIALSARRTAVQVLAVLVAVAGVAVIGVSRLYLGVHWMTDVLTGWVLGGAWLAACVTALFVVARRTTGQGEAAAVVRDEASTHARSGR